jgi:predicted alpha/beta superfamily hydrolase
MNSLFYNVLFASLLYMATPTYAQSIRTITLDTGFKDQQRTLLVALPNDYEQNTDAFYEVIYVFDSQAAAYFDTVHASIDFLQPTGCGYIVVGVPPPHYSDDYHRFHDFLPSSKHATTKIKYGMGNAEGFLDF